MIFSAKSMRHYIGMTIMIFDRAVIVNDELHPSFLPQIQILLHEDMFQAFVVSVYVAFLAVQVMPPDLQSKHHCAEFQIMSGIVSLVSLELSGSIDNDFPMLHQYTTQNLT